MLAAEDATESSRLRRILEINKLCAHREIQLRDLRFCILTSPCRLYNRVSLLSNVPRFIAKPVTVDLVSGGLASATAWLSYPPVRKAFPVVEAVLRLRYRRARRRWLHSSYRKPICVGSDWPALSRCSLREIATTSRMGGRTEMLNLGLCKPADSVYRVLCLGAHSDDIEIGCGGTILALLERHDNVVVRWIVFSSNEERAGEARASADAFLEHAREKEVVVRNYRDGFFPFLGGQIKDEFETLKREFSPDLVFTHHRDDRHQDHRLISDLTWNTFRNHLILEYEIPKYDGDLGAAQLLRSSGKIGLLPEDPDHHRQLQVAKPEAVVRRTDLSWRS